MDDEPVQYTDAYRPSYNAGPHFYLPVLRYIRNGADDEEAEDGDGADKASGRTKGSATDEPVTTEERREEKQQLAADEDFTTDGRDDTPTFNPASALPAPTSKAAATDSSATPTGDPSVELVLQSMRWGLVPHWTAATSLAAADSAQSYSMTNARSESVDQAKTYRGLLKRRRCCVVVDSYYEWHAQTVNGRTKKQPINFVPNHRTPPLTDAATDDALLKQPLPRYERDSDDKPYFLLAGLYDTWRDPSTDTLLYTMTILTTSAAQKLGWCHERQPVILSRANARRWLDVWNAPWDADMRAMVCRPWSDGVSWYKVPEVVGSVRNQQSECTQPLDDYLAQKKKAGIGKFFGAAATKGAQTGEEPKDETTGQAKETAVASHSVSVKGEEGVRAEGQDVDSGATKQEHSSSLKRERDDGASTLLRTPEKRLKAEDRASRSVSPASGRSSGSAARKDGHEPDSKSQLSLTSFFGKA